jgi:hypothetical protein
MRSWREDDLASWRHLVMRKECRSLEVFAVLLSFSCVVVLTLLHLQMCATPCVARCQGSGHICLGRGVVITCTLVGSTDEKTRRSSIRRFDCLIRGGFENVECVGGHTVL